ncbi:zinc finger protein 227-like [Branchiostoma floridae]|uniref:Zinc finger protein 227-like n=1 Tax=Branchiostoma floridae TaxID=7739 RepID=A0A9J7MEU6_BRAFL|nr:zinc finger protein 227-like [Branchiostoma floridae]
MQLGVEEQQFHRDEATMASTSGLYRHESRGHSKAILHNLNQQRIEDSLCDVTILVNGQRFRAHRAVLAACSSYFNSVFTRKEVSSMQYVEITDITAEGFSQILEHTYTSSLDLNPDNVGSVLEAAQLLKVTSVSEVCSKFLHKLNKQERPGEDKSEHSKSFSDCDEEKWDVLGNEGQLDDSVSTDGQQDNDDDDDEDYELPGSHSSFGLEEGHSKRKIHSGGEGGDERKVAPLKIKMPSLKRQKVDESGEESASDVSFSNTTGLEEGSLACEVCGKICSNLHNLKQHVRSHSKVKPFGCKICGTKFVQFGHMQRHEKQHEIESTLPFECSKCDTGFAVHTLLAHHMKELHEEETEALCRCKVCGQCFNESVALHTHLKKHLGGPPYECEHCRKQYSDQWKLSKHKVTHTRVSTPRKSNPAVNRQMEKISTLQMKKIQMDGNPYECSVCNTDFQELTDLMQHVHNTHTNEEYPFRCKLCKKSFQQHFALYGHMSSHVKKDEKKCEICDKVFKDKWKLKRHMGVHERSRMSTLTGTPIAASLAEEAAKKQEGSDGYDCEVCGAKLKSKKILKCHLRLHTGEHPYTCGECGATFVHRNQYDMHMSKMHTGEFPHMCEICGKQFRIRSILLTHVKKHNMERSYKCDQCPQAFFVRVELERHKRIHTGEKPYVCDLCGSRFSTTSGLYAHQRTHSAVREHKCEVCGKTFSQLHTLKQHRSTHSLPYRCHVCGKGHARLGKLREHVLKSHGENEVAQVPKPRRKGPNYPTREDQYPSMSGVESVQPEPPSATEFANQEESASPSHHDLSADYASDASNESSSAPDEVPNRPYPQTSSIDVNIQDLQEQHARALQMVDQLQAQQNRPPPLGIPELHNEPVTTAQQQPQTTLYHQQSRTINIGELRNLGFDPTTPHRPPVPAPPPVPPHTIPQGYGPYNLPPTFPPMMSQLMLNPSSEESGLPYGH